MRTIKDVTFVPVPGLRLPPAGPQLDKLNLQVWRGELVFENGVFYKPVPITVAKSPDSTFNVEIQTTRGPARRAPDDDIRRCRTHDRQRGAFSY